MSRLRSIARMRRATLVAVALSVALLLAATAMALAASSVSIVDSGGRFQFQPGRLSVKVGDTVTWTNNTDAPHTISSDTASGPLDGSVSQAGTYQATFNAAGDFAYHCNIHSYMHGTVHVAALPPTDAAAAGAGTMNTGLLAGIAAIGSLLVITGFSLRLRRRELRAEVQGDEGGAAR